jgi:hypothetical protein
MIGYGRQSLGRRSKAASVWWNLRSVPVELRRTARLSCKEVLTPYPSNMTIIVMAGDDLSWKGRPILRGAAFLLPPQLAASFFCNQRPFFETSQSFIPSAAITLRRAC